jgi:putative transposase
LDEVYPIVYVDALMVKVRDGGTVRNKACYLVVGVDCAGVKHVLGIWVQQTEGAKFWAQVCTELRNRGVRDVLIACCDGLNGLPEAIEAIWPHTTVQTCTVHLIRAAMKFVSYKDRRTMVAALKEIYTAPNVEAAETALLAFSDSPMGRRYPAAVATWERAWERFTPFLAFPPALRRIIYTTNAIVTSSSLRPVHNVQHGVLCGWDRRRGRGYLLHRPVRRRCGGTRACSAGVSPRLRSGVVDRPR